MFIRDSIKLLVICLSTLINLTNILFKNIFFLINYFVPDYLQVF